MNNLLDLFYFAGDRVDYVVVHNPAKVRTNLFKKSNIEAELKRFGAKELTLPVVTSITLLAIKRAEAKAGRSEGVTVGNLEATADWGWAPDFVDAMRRMLALEQPGTFVVATGQRHTVRNMAEAAFTSVGLEYQAFVRLDGGLLHRSTSKLKGNPAKLRRETGWAPTLTFTQMMAELVRAELDRL